jgi:hypothetical protein
MFMRYVRGAVGHASATNSNICDENHDFAPLHETEIETDDELEGGEVDMGVENCDRSDDSGERENSEDKSGSGDDDEDDDSEHGDEDEDEDEDEDDSDQFQESDEDDEDLGPADGEDAEDGDEEDNYDSL